MAIYYIKDGELYHHGVKGMKWGVRRTRAQLGYKDSPKRKKTSDEEWREGVRKLKRATKKVVKGTSAAIDKIQKYRADKEAKKAMKKNGGNQVKNLSDAELEARIKRLQMEERALTLQTNINRMDPPKVSKGKQFVSEFGDKAVKPAMTAAGKTVLEKLFTKTLTQVTGVDKEVISESKKMLKDMAEEAGLQKQIDEARRAKTVADQAEYNFRKTKEKDVEKEIDSLIKEYDSRASSSVSSQNQSAGRDFVRNSGLLALPAPRDDD